MLQILYTVARNSTGAFVRAADAKKGELHFCGLCGEHLIIKRSGRTGPRTKRPHFAHKSLTPNCTPESALHFEFKNLLFKRIGESIAEGSALEFSWKCEYCFLIHAGNLVKRARKVVLEYSLENCRPDIVLLSDEGTVLAAIEIVVTHPPEKVVIDFLRREKIALVQIHLTSDRDLDDIDSVLSIAERVNLCLDRKRCVACGHFQTPILMRIIEAPCYSCHSKMWIPFIEGDGSRGSHVGPHQFSYEERELAVKHGASIQWQYSSTLNTKYWAATCAKCKRFIGHHFLFTDYIAPACYGDYPIQNYPVGDSCEYCGDLDEDEDIKEMGSGLRFL